MLRKLLACLFILFTSPAFAQSIQLAPGEVIGNPTAAARSGVATGLSPLFDRSFGTSGSFLYRTGGLWGSVTPTTAFYGLLGGQFVGLDVNYYGAVNDGTTNVTRYIADAATYANANRMGLIFRSGSNYRTTPIQYGGSYTYTCTFTGSIGPASTTLSVTSTPACQLAPGMSLTGAGVSANTRLTAYQTDASGFVGNYTVNNSQTVGPITFTATAPSCTADFSGTTMTVSACANGALNLVDAIQGTGVIAGQTITAFGTGTGGAGTYTLAYSQPTPLVGVTIRANPYTVVPLPNFIIGAPGGETQTIIAAVAGNTSPHALIKIVNPPALGAVLGFEIANLRPAAQSLYGNALMFYGFSKTASGGQPIARNITATGGTGSTCGVNIIGNAPGGVSWGVIESKFSMISSELNTVCDFNLDGNNGDGSHNIQAVLMERMSGNSTSSGPGFKINFAEVTCIDCLSQNHGSVPIAFNNVYHNVWTNFYSENDVGAISSTANTFGVNMTGTVVTGVDSGLLSCSTCNIDIHKGAGLGTFPTNTSRNFGVATGQQVIVKSSAVATAPVAATGVIGANSGAGLQLIGSGTVSDMIAYNKNGDPVCNIPTGVIRLNCIGLSANGSVITLGGAFTMSGAFTFTGTVTGNTAVTFPTSGTLATTSAGNIPLTALATQATNTIVGNATSGSASPTALAIGSCSTASSALIWTTNTGFGCNTSITAAAVPGTGLTGTSLAAGIVSSSLTSLGTITTLAATTANLGTVTFGALGETAVFGPGGTSVINSTLIMSGSSGSGVGARIIFKKNATLNWAIGDEASVTGAGTSTHLLLRNLTTSVSTLDLDTATDTVNFRGTVPSTSASTGTVISGGGLSAAGAIWAGTYVSTTPTTVAVSGTSCAIKGARWFVTDNATALAFGAVITSGGAIQTPIYCDGTVWRQGANDNHPMYLEKTA